MPTLPSGKFIPIDTAVVSVPGREFDWFEHVFGPVQRDEHVKAWKHHAFRLSDTGRHLMRKRLAVMYPGIPLELAHLQYATFTPDYHFDRRYI